MIGVFACQKHSPLPTLVDYDYYQLPPTFPQITTPTDNALTKERIELGRRLFYDPVLSVDSTVSCATCHKIEYAFSDNTSTTAGVQGRAGNRNVPSLINIAYHPYFTREGGVPTLEMQVLVPIQEHNEFDFNIVQIAQKLRQITFYDSLSHLAYNRPIDPFVITRAIAAFERTLTTAYSPFDQWYYLGEEAALSEAAKRGYDLFMSTQTNCASCHHPPHFTNFSFQNNGLYEVYADSGRKRLTNLEADRALFKVPSLRNATLTAPYMHDGTIATLTEVIEHYDKGGTTHANKSTKIQPLGLTNQQKQDLLRFLEALTDASIAPKKAWNNPWN